MVVANDDKNGHPLTAHILDMTRSHGVFIPLADLENRSMNKNVNAQELNYLQFWPRWP